MSQDIPIRDAATVVLLRQDTEVPRVLMGQRGHGAVFMPGKFVFPGGAVDAEDFDRDPPGQLTPVCARRLAADSPPEMTRALPNAALRELREETGLILPDVTDLHFVFRAITPPGRPRRFDARFFLVDAARLANDPDDFSRAEDELSHLQWVTLAGARGFDLPFVTRVVLAEVEAAMHKTLPPEQVPFYDHRSDVGQIRSLP
ncbi:MULTISPECIES: NUDIX hydrolase [Roseobacteraceae]|uniref:NUDIX hydrolase-like protein n=1 Tax=Celeribacter baekdonensis B30 TaxID=1208323 RepID=K2JJW7_9RHOB|nr:MULTISPECIES: NUDIX hydrolase [Roseobacteraceae]EKE70854.1 NUDIX hydrolase-like protein [Celeribacter baekdonensis B30]KAB6716161.1 NUDIX hydrolase [Roseobacter sp. TSBP12]|tara:strand:- start:727 stop:1332 length:606 start_codon:yes stop_codon:yes gene_type:complete